MNFWNIFKNMFKPKALTFKQVLLPANRVDEDYEETPIKEGEAYCRLWLVSMRLAKNIQWFTDFFPVVHSAIRFDHGGDTVTIPYLAGPTLLKGLTKNNLDSVIQCNHILSPLFPFNRGVVELQTGLFSNPTDNKVLRFIHSLETFAKLLPVPELSAVVKLADPVYSGVNDLFGLGGGLELGYMQNFVGDEGDGGINVLRKGYFVAILVQDGKIPEEELCVVAGNLCLGAPGQAKEFMENHRDMPPQYGYMLFRWEVRTEQDWESLTTIKNLVYQAQQAEDRKQADSLLSAIKTAVFQSPDVAKNDKKSMFLKIKQELQEWGLQAIRPAVRPSLNAIMQKPLPPVDAQTDEELTSFEDFMISLK
jgi:hypothetical protein